MTRILLVGCGKMGGALLAGWLEQGINPADMAVVEPHFDATTIPPDIRHFSSAESLPGDFAPELVLLAVKPQAMDLVLPDYRTLRGAVFVSIAAGRTVASLAARLGDQAAIVRAMPNIPASVRRGATALFANTRVNVVQKSLCDQLLAAVGEVVWVDDETQMDAVTALSGSGPAYVFLLVEALAAAGESLGLPADLAQKLARATVSGSGELLHQSPLPAATLRENVTSPNGTTYAALQVLTGPGGLTELMQRATAAAARRARELAS